MDAKAYDALERRRLKTGHNSFDHWYEYFFGDIREEEITRTLRDNTFEALHRKYFNDNDDGISRLRQHKFDELYSQYINRSHSIGQDMSFPSPVSNSWIEMHKFKNNMDNANSVNIFPETHEFKDNVNSVNTFPETHEIAQELHEEIPIDKPSSSQKTITPKKKQAKIESIDESTIQNEVKGTKRKKLKVCRPRKSSST
ncbi:hypothetical protein Glove_216g57 [Diversispora epigaea]|uniref:Uncharacterized protein n=1 Tax=Diversispora epigaea TaxID=1348612 RepID=A0A397IND8_9GLOM|nr:hypothetical protein Glove_216g57 [Diversispora epigaea]